MWDRKVGKFTCVSLFCRSESLLPKKVDLYSAVLNLYGSQK
jgi:hypothetical protein